MKLSMHGAVVIGLLGALSVACGDASENSGTDTSAVTAGVACTPAEQAAALKRMTESRLEPPFSIAGVDFSGPALTIADVERTACQSTALYEDEETHTVGWGGSDPESVAVSFEAEKSTGRITAFSLSNGFKGTLDFASRPWSLADHTKPNPFGRHTYSIGLGRDVLRDGQPWELHWVTATSDDAAKARWNAEATELFDAMLFTFAPDAPSTQTSCIQEGSCLARSFPSGEGIVGVRPLGVYFVVQDVATAPQTPAFFYGFTRPIAVPPTEPAERLAPRSENAAALPR